MGVRKIVMMFFLVTLCHSGNSQLDSTSFNFNTEFDSLYQTYNIIVSFEINSVANYYNISISFIQQSTDDSQIELFQNSYMVSDLTESNSNTFSISLGEGVEGFSYYGIIKVFDENELQVYSYSNQINL